MTAPNDLLLEIYREGRTPISMAKLVADYFGLTLPPKEVPNPQFSEEDCLKMYWRNGTRKYMPNPAFQVAICDFVDRVLEDDGAYAAFMAGIQRLSGDCPGFENEVYIVFKDVLTRYQETKNPDSLLTGFHAFVREVNARMTTSAGTKDKPRRSFAL
jgi:hypothetical protein